MLGWKKQTVYCDFCKPIELHFYLVKFYQSLSQDSLDIIPDPFVLCDVSLFWVPLVFDAPFCFSV